MIGPIYFSLRIRRSSRAISNDFFSVGIMFSTTRHDITTGSLKCVAACSEQGIGIGLVRGMSYPGDGHFIFVLRGNDGLSSATSMSSLVIMADSFLGFLLRMFFSSEAVDSAEFRVDLLDKSVNSSSLDWGGVGGSASSGL